MKLGTYNRQKGQSMVEYVIIASIVVVGIAAASNGITFLMRDQVVSTSKGLSSGSFLKK